MQAFLLCRCCPGIILLASLVTACSSNPTRSLTDAVVPLYVVSGSASSRSTAPDNTDSSAHSIAALNPSLAAISDAALEVSEELSTARNSVVEKSLSRNALRWDALPNLVPSARLNSTAGTQSNLTDDDQTSEVRLALQQNLIDFGKHASRTDQASSEIELARVEHWQERNQAVHDALVHFVEVLRYRKLLALSENYVSKHRTLESQITDRLRGGVSERSELALIKIRMQELILQKDTDNRVLDATLTQLKDLTKLDERHLSTLWEGTPDNISVALDTNIIAPAVLLAEQNITLAQSQRQETKSSILPNVMLEAYVENDDVDTTRGVGLILVSNSFAGFAYRANLKTADAKMNNARTALAKANRDFERELSRLSLAHENLLARERALSNQKQQLQASVDLFFDQFSSGVKPILDAIRVYESALDAARQQVSVAAEVQLNRLQVANLLGVIAPFPES